MISPIQESHQPHEFNMKGAAWKGFVTYLRPHSWKKTEALGSP